MQMRFRSIQFKILAFAAIVLLVLLRFIPRSEADQQSIDLGPIALELFDHCIYAAVTGELLSEENVVAEVDVISKIETLGGSEGYSLTFSFEDNFECFVEIPRQQIDLKNLRESLAPLKTSRFDGRASFCRWGVGARGNYSYSSILSCSLKGGPDSANIFQVIFLIIESGSVVFLVHPVITYDSNGYVTYGGRL